MDNGVTRGVFQLGSGSYLNGEGIRYWRKWLKNHYVRIGRDPLLWRADVLDFAHEQGWLDDNTPFVVLVARHYMRLRMQDDVRQVGAANDSDLYGLHPEHWTLDSFIHWKRREALRQCDLPQLKISPFARTARVRLWSHAELVANHAPPSQPS